ncbi:efflux RND transporter periplasmic adaptor subunit [Umboniibacter marinipuniceus]|uniref:HlyD family secretion protein n=1 Tax=Umboniibacter marinipuniceus TaxID=569599 RepID=A0A3M0A5Y1_9GAMM|nr:efflux RND transporter periplasmic adaptor subunit [Umboniibacter marinipuniceus]RMA80017.1 HlyD family secretion protein [Umboniibacter marinipuniceus]
MKNWLIIVAIVAAVVSLAYFKKSDTGTSKEVEFTSVTRGSVDTSVIASGALVFRNEVKLTSEVIGKVIELNVEEGDAVAEGDILLRLDPEQFQAEVDQQNANVRLQEIAIERQQNEINNLQSRWSRQKSLYDAGLIDVEGFEAIDHALVLAQLDLASREQALSQAKALRDKANEYLRKTIIRAPITGVVTALDIKVGETVISGTTNIVGSSMMTIANQDDILTEVYVDEADIAALAVGQRADVFAVAFPDLAIEGVVESIGNTARSYPGRNGLRFKVKIRLEDNGERSLFSGMSCRAEIYQTAATNAFIVPVEAVVTDLEGEDESHYVWVVENGLAKKQTVELGASSDETQVIRSGLSEGQQIVSGPFRVLLTLKENDPVSADVSE